MDQTDQGMKDNPRTGERALALSRTTARVHSLLNPDRVLETIGAELRDQGLKCYFGLLDDSTGELVLGHTNIGPETLEATEAIIGMPVAEIRLPADASAHLSAVLRDGETVFEKEVELRIGEVVPAPMKGIAFQLVELLQARQAIAAPLVAGSDALGILAVWSEHLTEEDVPTVTMLAQHAALAIERANLYEDEMRTVFEMEALRKTTLDMTRQLDLPQLLRAIVERAASLVGTKGGGLYLYRPEREELELVVSHNLGADYTGTRLKVGEGLSGRVILTGESMVIEQYSSWQNRSSEFDGTHFGGVLALPLKWGDKLIGVLNLTDGGSPRSFSDRDLWLMEWFANHAAVAIENARAFSETERKIQQLGALHEISLELLAETDHSHLLLKIVQKATELLDAQAGAIDLFDAESQRLEMRFSHGYRNDYTGIRLSPGQGVAGRVCQTRQPLAVDNYAIWPSRVPQVDEDEICAALGVPLLRGEELMGVLTIDRSEPCPFDEEDVQLATLFANQAVMALENARLYQEQERRAQELLALYETSLHVVSRLELHSLLAAIIARAAQLLRGESGDIYLYRPDTQDLVSAASHQMPPQVEGMVMKPGEGIAGTILETRQPLIVDDYESWPGRSETYAGFGFASVVGVPIVYDERLLGVVVVERGREKPRFTEGDQNLLTLFAHQAAVAIENSRLFEETKHTAEQLEALYEISTEIAAELDLSALLDTIVSRAIHLLNARAGGLYLMDADRQDLELIAGRGQNQDYRGIRLRLGEGACGRVAQTGEPLLVKDYSSWEGRSHHFEGEPTNNVLAVPIKHAGSLLGAIFVDDTDLERAFDDGDLRLASLLANQAAVAIRNARLFAERERTIEQLAALQRVSLEVVSKTNLSEVLPTIVRVAAELLDAEAGAIDLFDPESQDFELTTVYGYSTSLLGIKHSLGEGVVGEVARTKEPLIVNDYTHWPGRSSQWQGVPIGTVLGVPLLRADQLLGVLTIDRPAARPFDESDLKLATLFASQAAIAIENSRLFEETRQRAEELEGLYQVSTEVAEQLQLPALLDTIVRRAIDLLDALSGSLYLCDPAREDLELIAVQGDTRDHTGIRVARGEGACGKVVQSGEPVVVKSHGRWDGKASQSEDEPIRSALAVPFRQGDTLLGVLLVDDARPERVFDASDVRVATLFANQAAIAIQNARLFAERERTIRQLAALQDVSLQVVSKTDLSEVLPTIVRVAAQLLGAQAGAIDLCNPQNEELELTAIYGYKDALVGMKHALGEGVVGRVAQSEQALIVRDYANWDGRSPQWEEQKVGTVLGVPLLRLDQLLGVLTIDRPMSQPFDEGDVKLATLFANQAAIAIQNARTVATTKRRVTELTALREVSLQLTQSLDLATVLDTIVESAVSLVNATDAHIFLCHEDNNEFVFGSGAWTPGRPGSLFKTVRENGLTATVATRGEPVVINEARTHALFRDEVDEDRVMDAIAGFPLKRANQVLGVFNVAFLEPHTFDQDELRVLTLLADQAAIAIQNARTVDATKRRVTELTALREVSLQLTQSLDLATVLDTIVESAVSLVKATDAHIFLYHEDNNEFVFGSGAWAPGRAGSLFETVRENGLTATVAARGEPVVIDDARTHALFRDELDEDGVVDAIAGFPLKRANQVLGVFNVAFLEPHTFDRDELRVLTLLADQAAIAIENARLYEETDRRLKESQTLQEISRLVNSSLEAEEILQTVVEKLASAFGYSMVSIYTIEGEELRLGAQMGYAPEAVPDTLHLDSGITGRVARSGEAALVPDVGADPDYLPVVPGIVSEIAVPIQKNHHVLGVLNVESSVATPLTEADLSLVSSMAHQVSVAMQNAELYQAAQQELAERKRAEESYRAVVDHSLQGLAIIQDSRIVFANQAVVDILGCTLDELLALSPEQVRALIHQDDQELVWGRLLDRQSGKPVTARYDCRLVRRDGEVLWVEVFVNDTEYQGRPSIQAAVVDITGRKRAQEELRRSYLALTSTLEETVNALAALAEIRDLYTAGHQQRVSQLACAIAERMGLSEEQIQGISMAGLVHDIGKIQVPAEILANPRELTDLETQMIRTHPQNAYEILCKVDFPWPVADIVLQHHERVDGSGYPNGLTKTQILEQARILAVADVVEAMASDRPYRPAHSLEETLEEITGNAGDTYDAEVVHALMTLLRESNFDLASLTTKPPPSEE